MPNLRCWAQTGKVTQAANRPDVKLQCQLNETGVWTVQFGLFTTGIAPIMPQAEIIWKVNGNQLIRRVSVGGGTSIGGIGEAVEVEVSDVLPATEVVGAVQQYNVAIVVSNGTRPSSNQPPQLAVTNNGTEWQVNAGGTVVVPIPQNIGATSVFTTAQNAGATVVLTPGQALVSQIGSGTALKDYDANIPVWVPLSPTCDSIELFNHSAQTLFFSVTLGIDG